MATSLSSEPAARPSGRGRPREFDMDEALDRLIQVFSERGYHGASITDLIQATNLSQGSLYKAFKDKEAIFLAALERYCDVRAQKLHAAIGTEGSGLDQLRRALAFYAASSLGDQGRKGCLVVGSLAELTTFPEQVALQIQAALERNEALLSRLLHAGQQDGSIPLHMNVEASARMLLCLVQGMRIVGKVDGHHANMTQVVDVALAALI